MSEPDARNGNGSAARSDPGIGPAAAVSAATVLFIYNLIGLPVALESIEADLGASATSGAWIVDGFALALTSVLLPVGAIADRVGQRRVLLAGLAVLGAGAALCALAPSVLPLIGARILGGVGGGMVFGTLLAILGLTYSGDPRRRAMAAFATSVALAAALGPPLSAILVESIGWRSIFGVATLGAVLVALAALRLVPAEGAASGSAKPIDWAGSALLAAIVFATAFACIEGRNLGWDSPVVAACVVAAIAGSLLLPRVERGRSAPVLRASVFRSAPFRASLMAVASISVGFAVATVFAPQALQAEGLSPLLAALGGVTPFAVAMAFGSSAGARLPLPSSNAVRLVTAISIQGVGFALVAVAATVGPLAIAAAMTVAGLGAGLINPLIMILAVSDVAGEDIGAAAGINNAARQLSFAIGIAALTALAAVSPSLEDALVPLAAAGAAVSAAFALSALASARRAIRGGHPFGEERAAT